MERADRVRSVIRDGRMQICEAETAAVVSAERGCPEVQAG